MILSTQRQLIAFTVVGILNTLVGYSFYSLFIFCNMDYPAAMFWATVLGVLFNYKTTGKLVFKNNQDKLFKFICGYAAVYLFNIGLLKLMKVLVSNLYLAGLFSIIPTAIVAFILNKFFIFKEAL